jgi:hypothetical protein
VAGLTPLPSWIGPDYEVVGFGQSVAGAGAAGSVWDLTTFPQLEGCSHVVGISTGNIGASSDPEDVDIEDLQPTRLKCEGLVLGHSAIVPLLFRFDPEKGVRVTIQSGSTQTLSLYFVRPPK